MAVLSQDANFSLETRLDTDLSKTTPYVPLISNTKRESVRVLVSIHRAIHCDPPTVSLVTIALWNHPIPSRTRK